MPFGLSALDANASAAQTGLNALQHELLAPYRAASSGTRIGSAADDPSGLAIAASLTTQALSTDQGSRNAIDAGNALNVGQGALQTTTDALQSLRSLAVSASNDLLSPADRQGLQAVANGLVRQINADAQNANFNGTPLLQGTSPATAASATVTSNAALSNGGDLVAAASASGAAQGGTIGLSVVDDNGTTGIDVTFTATQTGSTTDLGVQAPGATVSAGGATVTLGNVSANDVGTQAVVQVQAAAAAAGGTTPAVQTGAAEGATTALTLPSASAQSLFLQNVDLSSTASATNAIGQIDAGLGAVTAAGAQLGAQQVSNDQQVAGNDTQANALTDAASAIARADAPATSTELYQLYVQQQISLETLRNANADYGFLNRFFSVAG